MPTAENLYSCSFGNCQTTYWGQLPPDTAALQTAGTALYNLSYAWTTTIQNQTTDQLAAEAAAYTPSVSVSFQDQINNIASSTNQATGLEANLLVNPYLEMSSDPADAKAQLVAGGENAFAASIDEGSVLTELKKIENENNDDCDPVKFRHEQDKDVITNDAVKTANKTFGNIYGKPWDQIYKDQGIQWKSANSGTTANQQGLPYEAWVQNKLNPLQDPNGVVWLQDEKHNWKAFDHWDEVNKVATSDKTINLSGSSYQDNPWAVAARVEVSVEKMIKYDEDRSKISNLTFDQDQIQSYALNLAVPWITSPEQMDGTLSREWKELCFAYHQAIKDVAASGKSLSFTINTVQG